MIRRLRGAVADVDGNVATIDVQGVGYGVRVPEPLLAKLSGTRGEVTLYTELISSDSAMDLYGFESKEEREMFNLLRSVSGVGPKVSLKVLGLPKKQVAEAIANEDFKMLTRVEGVGKKIAQRLVLELKDKLGAEYIEGFSKGQEIAGSSDEARVAVQGLQSLGYSAGEVQAMLRKLDPDKIKEMTADRIIKECLKAKSR